MRSQPDNSIGPIALFGSGETSPAAQRIHHEVMSRVNAPVRVAIIETPAGFEPNSDMVAQKIAEYLAHRLQNFSPQIELVPARIRGTDFSPDDPSMGDPIFRANYVFMGPGSPTYAVRQLRDSYHLAQHVGAAPPGRGHRFLQRLDHQRQQPRAPRLRDLQGRRGAALEGGARLLRALRPEPDDYAALEQQRRRRRAGHEPLLHGAARDERLLALLPELPVILGIEENTGVVIDPHAGECTVVGAGEAIVIRDGEERRIAAGGAFAVDCSATGVCRKEATASQPMCGRMRKRPHAAEADEVGARR